MKPSRILFTSLLLAGVVSGAAHAALPAPFAEQMHANYPAIETLYQELHRNPELGFSEHQTAANLAKLTKALGFEVTTGVGGTGVVAILRNGPGPTVMLRTDLLGKVAALSVAACSEDTYSAPPPAAERAMADARVRRKKRLVVMGRLARQGKKE